MGIFTRLFKIGQAEAHSVVDSLENPIKLTEQGIRDLKKDLDLSLQSLAEVKAITIRQSRQIEDHKRNAVDYEKKATLLLQKAQTGQLDKSEADRLALQALGKKEEFANQAVGLFQEKIRQDQMVSKLESNVAKLKSQISSYENQLSTLKARHTTATATAKLNKQLAQVDSTGTIAMLEKMKEKVEQTESLAEAYGDVALIDRSVENEIDRALESGHNIAAQDSLAALKQKMGI